MQQLQSITKKYLGSEINITEYAHVFLDRCIKNEQMVYLIAQSTKLPDELIISRVQDSVISFEETLKFATVYRMLPTECQCREMFLMGGFEFWNKLNKKA